MNNSLAIAAFALLAVPSLGLPQTCPIVIDLNVEGEPISGFPDSMLAANGQDANLTAFNGNYYFSASTIEHGIELYSSDGTSAGTQILADISLAGDSNPVGFTEAGGKLFFLAEDDLLGRRLRVIDPGSPLVFDSPLAASSQTVYAGESLAPLGSNVVFIGSTDSSNPALWISDGTTPNTHALNGIGTASNPSSISQLAAGPFGTHVYASADVSWIGIEVLITDGTSAGTRAIDVYPGASSSKPKDFTSWNGLTYFSAIGPGTGRELWVTDGTQAGTHLVKDIAPSLGSSSPDLSSATAFGGELYFSANDHLTGTELWKTDGTAAGTVRVTDLAPGLLGSNPRHMTVFAGHLMLNIDSGSPMGRELYKLDPAGQISLVADIYPGSDSGLSATFSKLTVVGNALCFSANSPAGEQLWMTDGTTAGTQVITSITANSPFQRLTPTGTSSLMFLGDAEGLGRELWTSDLTPAGTQLLVDIEPIVQTDSFFPKDLISPNGLDLVFFGKRSNSEYGLWKLDHSKTLTKLADINYMSFDKQTPLTPVFLGGQPKALFSVHDQTVGYEPWITDYTPSGTHLLRDIIPGIVPSNPRDFTQLGGQVVFTAEIYAGKRELFSTDGTAAGTRVIHPINSSSTPGQIDSHIMFLTKLDGKVIFRASNGMATNGQEIWASDGTSGGTNMLMDINPGSASSLPASLVNYEGRVYFSALTPSEGYQIWSTDGTAAGTSMLIDLESLQGSQPKDLFTFNGLLYFTAWDSLNLVADTLFRTDGTAAGTVRSNADSIGTELLRQGVVSDGVMYFSHFSSGFGYEPWRSDGTQAGTSKLVGALAGSPTAPRDFIAANDGVFFSAQSSGVGRELWFSNGTQAGTQKACAPGSKLNPADLVLANGKLYFSGAQFPQASELFHVPIAGAYSLDIGPVESAAVLASNAPQIGTQLTITCDRIPPASVSLLIASAPVTTTSSLLTAGESSSWIDLPSALLGATQLGTSWAWTSQIPSTPSLVGAHLNLQAYILPGASFPAITSNGLSVVIGN